MSRLFERLKLGDMTLSSSIAAAPMTRQRATLDAMPTKIVVSAEAYVDCPACADAIAGVLQPVDEPPMPTRPPATGGHLPAR